MPEGPEVETIVNDLNSFLIGQHLVAIFSDTTYFNVLLKPLINAIVLKVFRTGKIIVFELEKKDKSIIYLTIHLLMTGQLWIQKESPKYTRFSLLFNNHTAHFADRRKLGKVNVFNTTEYTDYIKKLRLGKDVLSADFSIEDLNVMLKSKKNMHSLLLDQSKISGLGNIYVNEILFKAKINPYTTANNLTDQQKNSLYDAIKLITSEALNHNGTSFSDYITPKGSKGTHQNFLQVFKRKGQKCLGCGEIIIREKAGSRGIFYCKKCQKQ